MFTSLHATFSFNICPINKPPKLAGFFAYTVDPSLSYSLLEVYRAPLPLVDKLFFCSLQHK